MPDKLLICTDLDRTLIPNGEHPESPQARCLLEQLLGRPEVKLTYVTGRHKKMIQVAIEQFQLPTPDFVIADVGATIYEIQNSKWLRYLDWDKKIATDWQKQTHQDIAPFLSDLKQCRLQEDEKQGPCKLSYYIPLDTEIEPLMDEIQLRMKSNGIQAHIVWSVDEAAQIGLLDILPLSANKRKAIEFLMQRQFYNINNTVFAGDSGNDLDVLISPLKSILVANARSNFKQTVKRKAEIAGFKDALYIAQGDFVNMNGNYAAGIIEGIFHYFPELKSEIRC